ncbi:DUF3093 domain-containing protein [Nocardioides sambongensis]|uniref:DUF3093 domain-containing protein n=1 Tax=Nocardioides sambongensis TaxID=2589074 RepID=UPI001E3F3574|nr:DUF3093 domain-containing protein [Nocardioides sambongensis]
MNDGATRVEYNERLGVPLRWWVQGTMLIATLWIAMIVAIPDNAIPWVATGAALALLALCLFAYGDARIVVRDGWLRAGRARIETRYIAEVRALDQKEAWRVSGPDADARAFLLLRPYVRRAVQVRLDDPADPTPYWLLSSRHPNALADALEADRARHDS